MSQALMILEYRCQDMLRSVLNRLTAYFGSGEDATTEEREQSQFIPSVLDSSVRYSHGGSNPEGDREIAKVNKEAQKLAEHHQK